MSEESHHHGKHEIIIVKRHKGDHDGAHGGAWKIAYADFMTAMMAFFLIMWLVNAANEPTKAAIQSYFNPIKLNSSVPPEEGIEDPKKAKEKAKPVKDATQTDTGQADAAAEQADAQPSTADMAEVKSSDADYFENPYAVIAEIAKETEDKANISEKGDGGAQDAGPGTGADGGDAFRDPFDPDFWTQQVEVSKTSPAKGDPAETVGLPGDGEIIDAEKPKAESTKDKSGKTDKEKDGKTDKEKDGKTDKEKLAAFDKDKNGKLNPEEKKLAEADAQAKALEAELRKSLGKKAGFLAEGLTVTPAEGGLLISITDQTKTAMFRSGSAIPTKETVFAIDKIARLLKGRKGLIAIRGHTDGRPYANKNYDNWRLSTARAQSAYFMLVNGGVDEKRISQISGFADQKLKLPDAPLDSANRRIEILLQADPAG